MAARLAMDRVAAVKRVVVLMEPVTEAGEPKILQACALLLTGRFCVDLIITDLCVLAVHRNGGDLTLVEFTPNVDEDEVKARTAAPTVGGMVA